MPEPGACPDPAELAEFHANRLAARASPHLLDHVESCEACRAELAELALDDSFAHQLRDLVPEAADEGAPPRSNPRVPDPQYEALLALLRSSSGSERYEVLGELGRGGMGVVYEVHDRVLRRNLAMKVVGVRGANPSREASPTGRRLARFLQEARITGRLDHPSIIPVYELGIDAEGRAYFTMRTVRGMNLHDVLEQYVRRQGGWTQQRLIGIVQRVCDAVAYAHTKGVVHRDLKPANIMVGRFGAVYVVDWGVAKVVDDEEERDLDDEQESVISRIYLASISEPSGTDAESATPPFTLDDEIVGTPTYMSPEQARGGTAAVDLRADVYSMGAILYHLLSGKRPYAETGGTPREAWRDLLEGPPARLNEIAPQAPPELIAVCERAMAREPGARYGDMEELASDLLAWLEGRVVRAHRTGVAVEVRKWVARNRALATAALVAVLAVALLPVLLLKLSAAELRNRERLKRGELILQKLGLVDEDPAQALITAIQISEADEDYVSRTALLSALVLNQDTLLRNDAFLSNVSQSSSTSWCGEGSRRAWSRDGDLFAFLHRAPDDGRIQVRLWNVAERALEPACFDAPEAEICILHPDGLRIASAGADGSVAIHHPETGSLRLSYEGGRAHSKVVSRLAFDPRGELLASASWDGTVRIWNAITGDLQHSLEGHTGIVTAIEFDAGGKRLLSASGPPTPGFESDFTVRVWRVASGECLRLFEGHEKGVTSARFRPKPGPNPGEDLVLSTSYDETALLWEARTGVVRARLDCRGAAFDGAFSADGSTLAVAFDAGFLVRDAESERIVRIEKYDAHSSRAVTDVEFSRGGDRLLTTGNDGFARVWKLDGDRTREELALRLGINRLMNFGSWSPDGSGIASVCTDGIRLWSPRGNPITDRERPTSPTGRAATHARFHPDGDRVLLTFEDSPAYEYVFEEDKGLRSPPLELGSATARDVVTSPDGTWTLVAEEGVLGVHGRNARGVSVEENRLDLDATSLHPARDGDLVGVILAGGGATILDCADYPEEMIETLAEEEVVRSIAFSEDGGRAVLGTAKGLLIVVELQDDPTVVLEERLSPGPSSRSAIFDARFSDGDLGVVSTGPDSGVRVWNIRTGESEVRSPSLGDLGGVLVPRDGRGLLVRAEWRGAVTLTDSTGRPRAEFNRAFQSDAHGNLITSWSLDRAERRLLTTSTDRTATVWDLTNQPEPWVSFSGHDVPITAGDLSRDGQWAVTADDAGFVYVWPVDPLVWALKAKPVDSREATGR